MWNSISRQHGMYFLEAPEGEGEGGTGGGGGSTAGTGEKKERQVSDVVRSLIRRYGDAHTALGVLAGENRDYRRRHQRDQATIQDLQGKVPEDGIVLTKDQVKQWEAYQAMGKPEEIKPKLEKLPELEGKVAAQARKELLKAAAGAVAPNVSWNPDALEELVTAKGLDVEMRDVTEKNANGEEVTVKRPHVRPSGKADDPFVPVSTWVEQNAKVWTPSLTAGATTNGGTNGGQPPVPGTGLPVPGLQTRSDGAGGTAGDTNPVLAAIKANESRAKAPNPLRPQAKVETK